MSNRTEIIENYIRQHKDLIGFTNDTYNELIEEVEISLDNRNKFSDKEYIEYTCDVIYDYFIESL